MSETWDHEHEGEASPPPSPSKRAPPALPIGAKKAAKTNDGYANGLKYIEMFLKAKELPSFSELTDEDVEADHLQNFIDNMMHWLATTQFPTRAGYLDKTSKVTYFSNAKSVWKYRFPKREDLWKNDEYWRELTADFKKKCDNSRMADPNVEELRKSAPLYRDLSGARCTAVRAKYLNDKVDARSIAMAMIMDGSQFSVQKLLEFVLCRAAIGRGGEHVFLR
jgi:hypothetical protein